MPLTLAQGRATAPSGYRGDAMRLLTMIRCQGVVGLALFGVFCATPIRAQLILPKDGETTPSFEVATVKPAAADARGMRMQRLPDGFRMVNVELSVIVRNAYGAHSDAQLVGGPEALLDQRFDVEGKMDADTAAQLKAMSRDDQQRRNALMMQALLRDRFQLKMHVEMRELPVYALLVAKGGSKLQPSAPAPSSPSPAPEAGRPLPDLPDQLPQRPPPGASYMRVNSTKAEMSVSGGTMEQLAGMLTGQDETGDRVIIDKTGLAGKYDWHLEWAREETGTESKSADGSPSDSDAPGLFTALQQQLGLRLEAQKGPVQVIVVDHLEAPSPN
jgi:uncharacterized protein (TIGR03435 family)